MAKKIFLLKLLGLLSIMLFHTVKAQNKRIDSLLNLLENKTLKDTSQILLYTQIAKEYTNQNSSIALAYSKLASDQSDKINFTLGKLKAMSTYSSYYFFQNNYDSSLHFVNQGLSIPRKEKYPEVFAELLKKKGMIFFKKGSSDSAISYLEQALSKFRIAKDSAEIIRVTNNLGAVYMRQSNYNKAISNFFTSLKYNEKHNNPSFIASDYNNIATVLMDKNDLDNARIYLGKSLKIREKLKDSIGIAKIYLNFGGIFITEKNYPKAITNFETGLRYISILKHPDVYSLFANNMGICYSHTKNYSLALNSYTLVLDLMKKTGQTDDYAGIYGNIGNLYYLQKDYKNAIQYNSKSYEYALLSGEIDAQRNAQKALTRCFIKIGNSENALTALENYISISDSLNNINVIQEIEDIRIKHETAKKDEENKLLLKENELKQSQISSRNKTIIAMLISILLIILIVLWRINVSNLKKKQVELENLKLMQKEKERISRDLHDNVGGQLSYVLFSLEGDKEYKNHVKLANITDAVRNVISNLRQTIWVINEERLTLTSFSDKLKSYTKGIFNNMDVRIVFEETIVNDIKLNPSIALNIFRVCQEIVNNAFKHSRCTELKITISNNTNTEIVITDNGIGITNSEPKNSFGLTNINQRISETGAKLEISSEIGKGTSYRIIVHMDYL